MHAKIKADVFFWVTAILVANSSDKYDIEMFLFKCKGPILNI